MKGKAVGAARVSERHGNFIVNEGGASYAQVIELIARGIDMFDCVLPTRLARKGHACTH